MATAVFSDDYQKANDALGGYFTMAKDTVAQAIAAERERCAKVVENMGRSGGRVRKTHKMIAAEIRAAKARVGR